MIAVSLVAVALPLALASSAQDAGSGAHLLNLSCVEALAAVGESRLAGVFAFVPEKDSAAAFADLIVHDKNALKKFVAKAGKDMGAAHGVSQWDHDALAGAVSILSSPLGETVEKPAPKLAERLVELSQAPALALDRVTAARRKK